MSHEKRNGAAARTLVVAGGGTGGHLFPGLALAGEYRRRFPGARIVCVGVRGKIEERAVPAAGYDFHGLDVAGVKGMNVLKKVSALIRAALAVGECRRLMKPLRPAMAIGVGGYSSGPAGVAARSLGIPLFLQEQNTVPGLTNRLLGRLATRVFLAFGEAASFFPPGRAVVTGNPVRPEAVAAGRQVGTTEELRLLVLGGSRGARGVNRIVTSAAGRPGVDRSRLAVVHQAGEEDHRSVTEAYEALAFEADVRSFIDDMGRAYDWADVVISRSGAGAVSEIAASGRAALFIPYPHAAGGHQQANARWLAGRGGAVIVDEGEENAAGRVAEELRRFQDDRERLRDMARRSGKAGRKDAAGRIIDECVALVEKEGR